MTDGEEKWCYGDRIYCYKEPGKCSSCHPCHKVSEGKEKALVPG